MMNSYTIAMVNYYNTLPFLYGLEEDSQFNLIMDIPSRCMTYFESDEADIALVPVATLLHKEDYQIITDYCIGCEGKVKTVCLFSNVDIQSVEKIYLDKDSRTSQLLVKVLCEKYWQINPVFVEVDVRNMNAKTLGVSEAVLMIGDKVFGKENEFKCSYDLGEEWKKMTGLPFAFAVWVARPEIPKEAILRLNGMISKGVNAIDKVVEKHRNLDLKFNLDQYFQKYIDYNFKSDKKESLDLFFRLARALETAEVSGG